MNGFEIAKQIKALAASFEELAKAAPEVRAAMRAMHASVKEGKFDPKHADAIRRGLFTDRLTGGIMGNQAAFEDFEEGLKSRNIGGVHIRMDANDFKSINTLHGYAGGDEAIKQMAGHIRDVLDTHVGQSRSKLFRLGGDEFHAWVPDHESAARFMRAMRSRMQGLVPFKGTHNWSMSYGLANHPQAADEALNQAKVAKTAANHPKGQSEHYAHSLMPGSEGPIPLTAPLTRFNVT